MSSKNKLNTYKKKIHLLLSDYLGRYYIACSIQTLRKSSK